MGDDLGVRLGLEGMTLGEEQRLEGQVVFNDSVMNHHDIAMTIPVRMGVFLGGTPVRRPARVADPERTVDRVHADGLFQIAEFALGAPDFEPPIAAVNGQAGRIVSSILEPPQAFQNDWNGLMGSYVANYSTHSSIISAAL